MSRLVRFGVSIDQSLLKRFDKIIENQQYKNRSEAIRDLIRDALVDDEWSAEVHMAGSITMVYDHDHSNLVNTLLKIQHSYHDLIITSQHIHVDHNNCLEIIIVKGRTEMIRELYDSLRSTKGIKHINITRSTTGQNLS